MTPAPTPERVREVERVGAGFLITMLPEEFTESERIWFREQMTPADMKLRLKTARRALAMVVAAMNAPDIEEILTPDGP